MFHHQHNPKRPTNVGKPQKAIRLSQSSGPTTLVVDETVHEERGDSVERAATNAASLDAAQDYGEDIIQLKEIEGHVYKIASDRGRNEFDQDEGTSFVQEDAETQGRYDHDIRVTTASAPITTAGVSVSTAEPSTPPTTTTMIEDEDLTID
ncbi:hypothetical protein Tco_0937415 [Tanacetum coccineum]|uniref:Uncharacterized protein n=1 Tax=Tanacetum coccineum TaxID=301880 RepID=A0ABQ5DE62_9ASTR